ncbi:MAG: glutamine synthetase III [Erysipelotrichaceae bacterium]|nr:glutamine synthetase III [Erysipelotrichaceae bacterium]
MAYDFSKFGSHLFDDKEMRKRLPSPAFQKFKLAREHDTPLDSDIADVIAHEMKQWALEHGCTHYTHWFHPLTGTTAEKHNSFVEEKNGEAICRFSGKSLIKDEPDASSFPSGGLRATFEARGYTYWDVESPAFIRGHVLYIPTIFISYTGESLDTKGPLLKSADAVSAAATRIVNSFGDKTVKRVKGSIGLEQEYFLVDKKLFSERRDLFLTGKTLLGAMPPKGQELERHYFGTISQRVTDFMQEVNEELWDLGIYAKAEHNEVAPGQFEISPIYSDLIPAIDQNMLLMDVLQKVAIKHDLVCLLHEKPYAGVNGSGKHNNYSLVTDDGQNLFDPGKDPHNNVRFLLFTAALIKAVDEYPELIRLASSDSGNDFRLGADEAPPAIVSMYLGDAIEELFKAAVGKKPVSYVKSGLNDFGMNTIKNLPKDTSDRNRTSPIAFTGNKFEFRMLGSSLNASLLNTVINTALAKELDEIADKLDEVKHRQDVRELSLKIVADIYKKHERVVFSGNGYSDEWVKEAERRGLPNIATFVESIPCFADKKSVELFTKYNVFTEKEIMARSEIMYESFLNVRSIEVKTMTAMIYQNIIPSAIKELNFITACTSNFMSKTMLTKAEKLSAFIDDCSVLAGKCEDELEKARKKATTKDKDMYILNKVLPLADKLRSTADKMEHYISEENLPYPNYEKLFFDIDF